MARLSYDVVVFGWYYCDLIFTGLPRLPELGEEVFGDGFEIQPGGAWNIVLALHRLGVRVGWAVDFGDDMWSQFVLAHVRQVGLDEGLMRFHDRPVRRITVSVSFPEDRAFISFADPDPGTNPLAVLARCRTRLAYIPALTHASWFPAAVRLARLAGVQVAMDCQFQEETLETPGVRRAIAAVNLFMPNAAEARHLTGTLDTETALRALASLGPMVVVKDGAGGAWALEGGQVLHESAIPVEVVDTTGAGDCFNAGFLYGYLEGKTLPECLRYGNVCGGLSTTARGGATAAPTRAELEGYLTGSSKLDDVR